ncbi:MAG TPA: hemerythrin domain-containing protein [Chloroflexota bacterium]|nr:hemerythrin domain-containing protein [Chloroflexota bacterium]
MMARGCVQPRRGFLHLTAATGTALLLAGAGGSLVAPGRGLGMVWAQDQGQGEEVSANEDLMREHGILNRVLLVYEEGLRRLDGQQEVDPAVLNSAAGLIRRFVEDYHERTEENYLFPRFQQAGTLVDLVTVLQQQHDAGRRVTDRILALATTDGLRDPTSRQALADSIRQFIRMYRPHEAREDTVLFPAFHKLLSPDEYDALGDQFEDRERQMFGGDGFDMARDQVQALEQQLGIYDLAQFTPA